MKKISLILASCLSFIILIATICFFWLTNYPIKKTYVANSEFYWSSDAGATYGNRTKEYSVGETVFMQLIVKVESNTKKQEKIALSLNIPYVKDVSSQYRDGQIITPETDNINQITTYNFTIISKKNASETNFVFKFVPTKATDIIIKLTFDDKVSPIYDKQNTITFVKPKPSTGE